MTQRGRRKVVADYHSEWLQAISVAIAAAGSKLFLRHAAAMRCVRA